MASARTVSNFRAINMSSSSSSSQSLALFGSPPHSLRLSRPKKWRSIVTMKDRSNNPRPLQKGRNLSIEAIQTVQALKRTKKDHRSLEQVFDSKFRRLLKFDMMAVLRELLRQNECLLALKVFEDIRKEYWFKPQVSLYAEMVGVFGNNGFVEKVELVCLYLKREACLRHEIEDFNALLRALVGLEIAQLAMECFCLMKEVGCDPDRTTFYNTRKWLGVNGRTRCFSYCEVRCSEVLW